MIIRYPLPSESLGLGRAAAFLVAEIPQQTECESRVVAVVGPLVFAHLEVPVFLDREDGILVSGTELEAFIDVETELDGGGKVIFEK